MQSFEVKDKHFRVTRRSLFGWAWSQSLRGDEESTLNALSFIVAVWRSVREMMESIEYVRETVTEKERQRQRDVIYGTHTYTQ